MSTLGLDYVLRKLEPCRGHTYFCRFKPEGGTPEYTWNLEGATFFSLNSARKCAELATLAARLWGGGDESFEVVRVLRSTVELVVGPDEEA